MDDSNEIQTQNHLVRKRTHKHLVKFNIQSQYQYVSLSTLFGKDIVHSGRTKCTVGNRK